MRHHGAALLALTLAFTANALQADSLRDIYELALENDAQLRAEEAQYRANLERENLGLSALLPQVNANYLYQNADTDTERESIDFSGGGLRPIDTFSNTDLDTDGYEVSVGQALSLIHI